MDIEEVNTYTANVANKIDLVSALLWNSHFVKSKIIITY